MKMYYELMLTIHVLIPN